MENKGKEAREESRTEEVTDPKQLTAVYKKNGSFDRQRKVLLEDFKRSETHSNLVLKLKLMVENKIKNDPSILMKNRGKMGALIQGAIINDHMQQKSENSKNQNSLLSIVDKDIQEKIIDSPEFHENLKLELKEIKRRLLGVSDEDWEKQLEEEQRQKEFEMEQRKREAMEKEMAYKNNFKIKHINSNYGFKVAKAPRFNIGVNRGSGRDASDSISTGNYTNNNTNSSDDGLSGTGHVAQSYETKSGSDNPQSKDIPYMMY